jgi:hypothetical protein
MMNSSIRSLADAQLLTATHALLRRGRAVEAELLAHLGEVDARRLYLEEACPSMFVYCVRVLHFSESAAYKRIRAARAARDYPELLRALRRGELHVTAVSLLAAQLSADNCAEWIRSARHKTAEEIKRLLADRQPQPDRADCVRRLRSLDPSEGAVSAPAGAAPPALQTREAGPTLESASNAASNTRFKPPSIQAASTADRPPNALTSREPAPATSSPLGGERYRVSFTADGELHAQLQELRALLRHQIPDGDLAGILGRAVALLLAQVRKQKFAEVAGPRSPRRAQGTSSRAIPAAIRRAVTRRDEARCSDLSSRGRRCYAQEFLEFHQLEPWARKGIHSVDGITLRCRAHNQFAARRDFGDAHMAQFHKRPGARGPAGGRSSPG